MTVTEKVTLLQKEKTEKFGEMIFSTQNSCCGGSGIDDYRNCFYSLRVAVMHGDIKKTNELAEKAKELVKYTLKCRKLFLSYKGEKKVRSFGEGCCGARQILSIEDGKLTFHSLTFRLKSNKPDVNFYEHPLLMSRLVEHAHRHVQKHPLNT